MSAAADDQERIVGLLALPEVFGRGACDRFAPEPVELRATPRGPVVGTLLVVTPWTYHENGGCEGLDVRVRMAGTVAVHQLPTRDYGAVVLEQRGAWFMCASRWVRRGSRPLHVTRYTSTIALLSATTVFVGIHAAR
jgi:hypothetical protein